MTAPASQRQFIVNVSGIPGNFQTKSGGETSSDTTKNYDGGSLVPDVLASPAETDNITVSRAYNYERDHNAHVAARRKVGRWRTTVSVTPTDEDLKTIGDPTTYPDALLVRVSEPDVDSSSGDVAMFELEFAVGSVV
jgi:hypothetical protein